MASMLRLGATTYDENNTQTTIDLCWVSTGLVDRVTRCEVDEGMDYDLDHLLISMTLDLRIRQAERRPIQKWKDLDEKKFREALKQRLPQR